MDWANIVSEEEVILWQGRPAPRCYTFRYWKQALAGTVLFLFSSFWLMLALELIKDGYAVWLATLPLPLIIGSFFFGPFQIILARWRWPKIFYLMTDKSLYTSTGGSAHLDSLVEVERRKLGENLASLRILVEGSTPLTISCIEHPDQLVNLLQQHNENLKV